jgi:D-alanyl-D-alanine carboxypeptidase (penicillin-binding protein 5/6)
VLYGQNQDAKLYPASITKIMTAILALEKGNLSDMVKTSKLAREQEGNRIYLEYDEVQPLEKLLYGLMLNSGNDAAVAIAEHIGGSVEQFAMMMNEKAAELGMKNTHFVTPNGLHDDNHYTTPYDMALLSAYAMKNSTFRKIVATKTMEWHGKSWDSVLVNLNRMLWDYEGATGIKTGFTDQAQQTICVSAKRGGREIVAVLMGVENRALVREEATKLLDYGFDSFTTVRLARRGDKLATYSVDNQRIDAEIREDIYVTTRKESGERVQRDVQLQAPEPPYLKGTKVGTVTWSLNGQVVAKTPLYATRDVLPPAKQFSAYSNPNNLMYALLLVLTAGGGLLLIRKRRLRQRPKLHNRF